MGATVVKGERIQKTTRFKEDGILTEAAGLEVVSTAKSLKLAQSREKTAISKSKKNSTKQKTSKKKSQPVKSTKTKRSS